MPKDQGSACKCISDGEEWVTTHVAEALTGYSRAHLRRLAGQHRVRARKLGRDWLIHPQSLLAHKQRMDQLGPQRHNPSLEH